MGDSNGFYLDLEQGLYYLRVHFEMCVGAKDSEVLDWAQFFVAWSKKASAKCGVWSRKNLAVTDQIITTLQKSKAGLMGFEVLKRAMADAHHNLNVEIKETLKKAEEKKTEKPAGKKMVGAVANGDADLMDDTDRPKGRKNY